MTDEREKRLAPGRQKRILSLDGGGVRGLISLGILLHIERELASRSSKPSNFRLSQYFDLIGGTSAGALIAAMLAMGLPVQRVIDIFFRLAPEIFGNANRWAGLGTKFDDAAFDRALRSVFEDLVTNDLGLASEERASHTADRTTMATPLLKTGLAVVAKRADTNSVWVLTNNPNSKYWSPDPVTNEFWKRTPVAERQTFIPNSDYKLLEVLKASASAPYFFQPHKINVTEGRPGTFVDGGASPSNNPCQELLMMVGLRPTGAATGPHASPTGFGWDLGRDNLLMISVGTGRVIPPRDPETLASTNTLLFAFNMLHDIIENASEASTAWLQAVSHTTVREFIDFNVGDLSGLSLAPEPWLTFARFNPHLSRDLLTRSLGRAFDFDDAVIAKLHQMDNAELSNLNRCFDIGSAVGKKLVCPSAFPNQFDL